MSFFARQNFNPKAVWIPTKKSCISALIKFTEFISEALEQKLSGVSLFIDLKKAFDTVNHHILISKLEKYGFRGKTLDLIKSYFSDRSQYVFSNNKTSNSIDVNYSVPQGSILGPTFFLIYINIMPQCRSNSEVVLYADDTTITSCSVN